MHICRRAIAQTSDRSITLGSITHRDGGWPLKTLTTGGVFRSNPSFQAILDFSQPTDVALLGRVSDAFYFGLGAEVGDRR